MCIPPRRRDPSARGGGGAGPNAGLAASPSPITTPSTDCPKRSPRGNVSACGSLEAASFQCGSPGARCICWGISRPRRRSDRRILATARKDRALARSDRRASAGPGGDYRCGRDGRSLATRRSVAACGRAPARRGTVPDIQTAFEQFPGQGRRAYVESASPLRKSRPWCTRPGASFRRPPARSRDRAALTALKAEDWMRWRCAIRDT
jgi:hypothetical protein